ncbi:MAG: S1C family serine protease [Verrucomicrobiales bacterium]
MKRTMTLLLLMGCALMAADTLRARDARRQGRQGIFKFDKQFSREEPAIRDAFRELVAPAAKSTVRLRVGGIPVAFGVAVHSDGYIVTKASELNESNGLKVEFPGGLRLPALVLDRLEAYDLALLKVEATALTPIVWSDAPTPTPGAFLAAPSPDGNPVAIGVASVGARNLYEAPQGFLGVGLKRGASVIEHVYEGGAAERAGLLPEDELLAVEGTEVRSSDDLIGEVSRHRPGEEISVKYRRGSDEREARAQLMDRREFLSQMIRSHDPMELMHGRLSSHRYSFFNVFQHDLVLEPEECGGPLVDLDGHVVGLDIARAGRVESLAIPASDMKTLLANVVSGKFALPNIEELREELKKADLALADAQDTRASIERRLERAKRLLDTLPPPKKPPQPLKQMPAMMP